MREMGDLHAYLYSALGSFAVASLVAPLVNVFQVNAVVISGVVTNLCCESTARSAFSQDFRVFFLSDGTRANKKEHHDATLMNIAFGFGKVLTCSEFRKLSS